MKDDAPTTVGEFMALPSLASQFPIAFENGTRWLEFQSECVRCHKVLEGESLRGYVTRPFGKAYLVDGWGYCEPCNLVTGISYRLMPDMTLVGRSPKNGEWSTWGPARRVPWWKRLLGFG